METRDEPFLLTRRDAAKRYGLCQRTLDDLYRRDPTFPVVRVGKKVLIYREDADAWFKSYRGGAIATN